MKICFSGKGFPWDHTNLNRFIYIKNIAVTLCICYENVVTIVIVIKCAINFQCDRFINWLCKHMKKVRNSQAAILVLNWVNHSFSLWVSLSKNICVNIKLYWKLYLSEYTKLVYAFYIYLSFLKFHCQFYFIFSWFNLYHAWNNVSTIVFFKFHFTYTVFILFKSILSKFLHFTF